MNSEFESVVRAATKLSMWAGDLIRRGCDSSVDTICLRTPKE